MEKVSHLVVFVADAECFAHAKVTDLSVAFIDEQNIPSSKITMYKVLALKICHANSNLVH